ncbi:hypothetical protein [Methanococcoides methylutens]|uniref:hypothetical protein n=1 Tax=Methanococcoides methylutens TaxID=2226 RepID=UPI001082EC17|nr:hypothetical protein [Methanococcoides methylutens]
MIDLQLVMAKSISTDAHSIFEMCRLRRDSYIGSKRMAISILSRTCYLMIHPIHTTSPTTSPGRRISLT